RTHPSATPPATGVSAVPRASTPAAPWSASPTAVCARSATASRSRPGKTPSPPMTATCSATTGEGRSADPEDVDRAVAVGGDEVVGATVGSKREAVDGAGKWPIVDQFPLLGVPHDHMTGQVCGGKPAAIGRKSHPLHVVPEARRIGERFLSRWYAPDLQA